MNLNLEVIGLVILFVIFSMSSFGCSSSRQEKEDFVPIALVQSNGETQKMAMDILDGKKLEYLVAGDIGISEISVRRSAASVAVNLIKPLSDKPGRRLVIVYPKYPKVGRDFAFPSEG